MNESNSSLRVCSFESRKAAEMCSLIERQGGIPTVAPSMREVPLEENPAVFAFADAMFAGQIDVVIFLTGVGARTVLEVVESRFDRQTFFTALERCCVIVRGPKPTVVLRDWGVRIDHRAPEPNTWRELLATIDAGLHFPQAPDRAESVAGRTVAVQEYGRANSEFYAELQRRGTQLVRVPVYRWALPEDTGPLLHAIRDTIDGQFDVLMFTSANQLTNILEVAESHGLRDSWLAAANQCVVASIGPTASETLNDSGLTSDFEPSHPKMGHLVTESLREALALLSMKRKAGRH